MKNNTAQRDTAKRTHVSRCFTPAMYPEANEWADRWLRCPEAAAHLGISLSLLEKLDALGTGPERARIGRVVIYKRSGLDQFAMDLITTINANPET